jgi:acetyltransferase-like isoleucine patch superfamily enzyme
MSVQHLFRLLPLAGWVSNRLRFRGLHCGLRVEIDGPGGFTFGSGVRIGEGTRIELPPASTLAIGDGVTISRGVHLVPTAGSRLDIGTATTIQDNCRIYGDVDIGQRCIFAPNAFLSSGTHVFDAFPHRPIQEQERLAPAAQRPIRIHADCWFGINVVITPGVTVGRGCIVGANSVVTGDLPPYQVAAGSPARTVRKRLEFLPKARIEAGNEHDAPYFYDGFDLTRPPGDAWIAAGDFTLALAHANPRTVRVGISGNGAVCFAGETRDIGPASSVVEFDLAGRDAALPFLHFHAGGRCQVQWAELV